MHGDRRPPHGWGDAPGGRLRSRQRAAVMRPEVFGLHHERGHGVLQGWRKQECVRSVCKSRARIGMAGGDARCRPDADLAVSQGFKPRLWFEGCTRRCGRYLTQAANAAACHAAAGCDRAYSAQARPLARIAWSPICTQSGRRTACISTVPGGLVKRDAEAWLPGHARCTSAGCGSVNHS